MNIALPAFLIFLLVLPGSIFRASFHRAERTSLDFKPFASQTATSIIYAIFLHLFWSAITTAILNPFNISVDYTALLELLIGSKDDHSLIATHVAEYPSLIAIYYLSLSLFAFWFGIGIRAYVEKNQWDRRGPFESIFKFDTPWFYLFTGLTDNDSKNFDGVYLTAIVNVDGGSYLYQGALFEYEVDQEGNLDRVLLKRTFRRKLEEDNSNDSNTKWSPIEGDYFVLRYSEIVTLNIMYAKLTQ
ncbi:MAG: hypothetical protein AABY83_06775 [Pseudomonadota bacterium]